MSEYECSSYNINMIDGMCFCTHFFIMNCNCQGDMRKCENEIVKKQMEKRYKREQERKMATLKKSKNPPNTFTPYYCSECRMRQKELQAHCDFCGAEFSNYEEIKIMEYRENNDRDRNFNSKYNSV